MRSLPEDSLCTQSLLAWLIRALNGMVRGLKYYGDRKQRQLMVFRGYAAALPVSIMLAFDPLGLSEDALVAPSRVHLDFPSLRI
jgi:hypothetical protein